MSTVSKRVLPAPVLELRRRLEQWRRSRPKLGPIPTQLWRRAVELARAHGIHLVACALRLEYYALKRRSQGSVDASGLPAKMLPASAAPAFVEVALPPRAVAAEYLVEMERPDGGRMRVRLADQDGVVALSESFWRCRA